VSDLLTIVPSATYKDSEPGGVFRLQSYRLLRLLLEQKGNAVQGYITALRTEGGSAARMADLDGIEEGFPTYVETVLKLPARTPAIKVAEADAAKLAIHRGDVLLAAGRTSDAASWYNADSNAARAARAILNRFTRGAAEAIRSLDRASREVPESGLLQYHFGAVETRTATDIERQVQALERAVELLPHFGPAYAELARVYTLTGNAKEALPLISRALEWAPESADRFYEIRSDAHLAMGDYDEAFRTIKLADALPHSDRSATERFARRVGEQRKRIETERRDLEDKRLEQIRRDVAAKVEAIEPKPELPPPPAPIPAGQISYEIEARSRLEVLDAILPDYPEAMRKAGSAGRIVLRVDIGADGRVKAASVVSSQLPAMNSATIDAVRSWSFKAPRAVPGVRVIVNFLLQ
jgi:TonB family protein